MAVIKARQSLGSAVGSGGHAGFKPWPRSLILPLSQSASVSNDSWIDHSVLTAGTIVPPFGSSGQGGKGGPIAGKRERGRAARSWHSRICTLKLMKGKFSRT